MRIGMSVRHYGKQGGISRACVELAERLARRHEVHVFTSSWAEGMDGGVRLHKVPILKSNYLFEIASFPIMSSLWNRGRDFEVTHMYGETDGPLSDVITAQSCIKAGFIFKKRISQYFIEGAKDSPNFLKKLSNVVKSPLDWMTQKFGLIETVALELEERIYRKGNYKKITTVSKRTKAEIVGLYGVPPEDVEVIYNGVNLEEFHPANRKVYRREIREKHGISDKEVVILFTGHYFLRKGLATLIAALPRLPKGDWRVLVVGSDHPGPFQEMARECGVEKRIVFAGHSGHPGCYYAASDIFAFPTLHEPFGMVITEAMASALPVITTRIAGASELITAGYDGVILNDSLNTDELAWHLEKLLNNRAMRAVMGFRARKKAEEYSWDKVAEKTEEVYRQVVH